MRRLQKIADVLIRDLLFLNQQILTAVLLPSGSFSPLITVFFSHPQLPFPDPSSPISLSSLTTPIFHGWFRKSFAFLNDASEWERTNEQGEKMKGRGALSEGEKSWGKKRQENESGKDLIWFEFIHPCDIDLGPTHGGNYAMCIERTKPSEGENRSPTTWRLHVVETIKLTLCYQ